MTAAGNPKKGNKEPYKLLQILNKEEKTPEQGKNMGRLKRRADQDKGQRRKTPHIPVAGLKMVLLASCLSLQFLNENKLSF